MNSEFIRLPADTDPRTAFEAIDSARATLAVAVHADGTLAGILTRTGALRATLYSPAVDASGGLRTAAALGVNGEVAAKASLLIEAGVDIIEIGVPFSDPRTACWRRCGRYALWIHRFRSWLAT